MLDLANFQWELVAVDGPARIGAALWVSQGIFYVYGGTDDRQVHNDVWMFDHSGAATWRPIRTRGEAPPVSMLPGYRVACVGSTAYLWGADLS